MKKTWMFVLAMVLMCACLTAAAAEGSVLRCGAFIEEMENETWLSYLATQGDDIPSYDAEEYVMFDSLNQMLLALRADDIDYFYMTSASARYIQAHADDLAIVEEPFIPYGYRMALLPEKRALCERLSDAITALRADGSMQALVDTWVVSNADELDSIPLPQIDGAETIRVGVTGDLPPIDYAAADGTPSGFNVALLAALGDRMGVNFELVNVSPGARLMALTSGKIDVMFWMESYQMDDTMLDLETVAMTTYYYQDISTLVLKKESVERVKALIGLE